MFGRPVTQLSSGIVDGARPPGLCSATRMAGADRAPVAFICADVMPSGCARGREWTKSDSTATLSIVRGAQRFDALH